MPGDTLWSVLVAVNAAPTHSESHASKLEQIYFWFFIAKIYVHPKSHRHDTQRPLHKARQGVESLDLQPCPVWASAFRCEGRNRAGHPTFRCIFVGLGYTRLTRLRYTPGTFSGADSSLTARQLLALAHRKGKLPCAFPFSHESGRTALRMACRIQANSALSSLVYRASPTASRIFGARAASDS